MFEFLNQKHYEVFRITGNSSKKNNFALDNFFTSTDAVNLDFTLTVTLRETRVLLTTWEYSALPFVLIYYFPTVA